ncbi:MAG: cytochrome c [Anaerolineales bacterium]|nr:cytochrome c [Anaerolineales bacterium]
MQTIDTISLLRRTIHLISLGLMVLSLCAITQPASAQAPSEGETVFTTKCVGCHTIGGGDRVGPDLQGVTARRDITWLSVWMKEPDKMLTDGDPIALEMLAKYNNIPMPNMELSDVDVANLVAYFQSLDDPSTPASTANQPLTDADRVLAMKGNPEDGEKLYFGQIPQANGGLACIACHSVEGAGVLGGGALGPDLTHVYTRYGREDLAGVLGTLPFPTMQGIFTNKPLTTVEQASLLAFFARADQLDEPRTQSNVLTILGAGTGLAVILLVVMLFFWPRQQMSLAQRLRKNGTL